MSKEMTVIALGAWVAIVPYVGVSGPWRTGILVLTGMCIIVIGFLLRARAFTRGPKPTSHHPFVENIPNGHRSSTDHDNKERINSLN